MQYFRTPGYLRDLIQPSLLAYNKESLLLESTLPDTKNDDIEFYEQMIRRCAPYPTDLSVFYTRIEGRSMMSELLNLLDADVEEARFWAMIGDAGLMVDLACRILPDGESMTGLSTPAMVKRLEQAIPDERLRLRMLAFFLDPTPYLGLLSSDLRRRQESLECACRERFVGGTMIGEEIDWTELGRYMARVAEKSISLDGLRGYSYSIYARYIIERQANGILLLGADFMRRVFSETSRFGDIDLVQLGKLLAEPNRVDILHRIHAKGELCVGDLLPELDLSPTVVYYHLCVMRDSGLLTARNEKRVQYFRIDPRYLRALQLKFSELMPPQNNGEI